MSPSSSTRARAIADAALRLAAAERDAFVAGSCGDDAELLREVRSLVGAGLTDGDPGASTVAAGVATWGDLVLFEELGRGAFGVVYRAFDPALERPVALKLIEARDDDPASVKRLLHEGRLLARIQHPNIVTVYGAQHIGGHVGIWMELVEGRTLDEIVGTDGAMGPEEAAVIGIAVCGALNAVHSAGLVHRDVKARNVMRGSGGRIVLMDFGTGSERAVRAHFELAGTPAYMAPEVLRGEPASPASDVYSVGVLLYYLVTGTYPVGGHTFFDLHGAHERGDRRPLAEARPDLPDWFVRTVETALSVRVQDRYRTAVTLRRMLANGVAATPPGVIVREGRALRSGTEGFTRRGPRGAGDGARERSTRARRRRRIGGGIVALAAAAGIVLAGFLSSTALNVTLGRAAPFVREGPGDWAVWGLRALVAPVSYMLMTALAVLLLAFIVRTGLALSPGAAATAASWRNGLAARAEGLGLGDVNAQLQAVAAGGAIALALVCWAFADILAALTFVSDGDPSRFAALAPDGTSRRGQYGFALDLVVLATVTATYLVVRRADRARGEPAPLALAMPIAVALAGFLLWVTPYRVLWHHDFERARFAGARCYVLGENGGQVLLHCPDTAAPRNLVVRADDDRLVREGIIESMFTPAPARR